MPVIKVTDAPTVFKYMNGLLNIYKPAGFNSKRVAISIHHKICADLNRMRQREPRLLSGFCIPLLETGQMSNPVLKKLEEIDLSDHVLATGPRYVPSEIKTSYVSGLGIRTSGVLLMGINQSTYLTKLIQRNRIIRVYHVTGEFGVATDNHFIDSRINARARFDHVNPARISSVAAAMQASHQRKMYEMCGVDLQSQTAYELACQGLIRPSDTTQQVIYGIKLIEYRRPFFTLEIHAINEFEDYFGALIHDMALEIKTVARCTAIRCIRHGVFTAEKSLLRHNWNLKDIMRNLRETKAVLDMNPSLLRQRNIKLSENVIKSTAVNIGNSKIQIYNEEDNLKKQENLNSDETKLEATEINRKLKQVKIPAKTIGGETEKPEQTYAWKFCV